MYGSGGDGGAGAAEAQRQEKIRQGQTQLDQQFAGFNDDYYRQRGEDYTKFATPQVMDQYRKTDSNLTYALARNGILNGSAANTAKASLGRELQKNQASVANTALDQENQERTKVGDTRAQLTQQLIASGDPQSTMTSASAALTGLRAPTPLPALGNLFGDWSNAYINNLTARAYNPNTPSLWGMMGGA